jgi:hypothetical protein
MELKKVIIAEIALVIIVLVAVMAFIGITPYLTSSQQNTSIGVYKEKVFDEGNVTLIRGKTVQSAIFNYTTFDPAILVLDLNFKTWQSKGNLTIAVNDQVFATIYPTPENPKVTLKAVSFSGEDLVKPYSIYSRFFSNEIYFSSKPSEGYAVTFSYKISIRGSR